MKFVLLVPVDAVVAASSSTIRKFYLCDRHYSDVHRCCGHKSTIECALCNDKTKHIVCSKVQSLLRSIRQTCGSLTGIHSSVCR